MDPEERKIFLDFELGDDAARFGGNILIARQQQQRQGRKGADMEPEERRFFINFELGDDTEGRGEAQREA